MEYAAAMVNALLGASVVFLLIVSVASLMALFKGASELRRLFRASSSDFTDALLKSPLVPGVSVLLATRDDSPETRALVRRLLDLRFGKHEVILVLNGPSETVRNHWVDELRLRPVERILPGGLPAKPVLGSYASREPLKLLVVEVEAGSDTEALNAAINAAQFPVLAMVDARAEFTPEWLLCLVRPMMENWERIAGVCAAAMPAPSEGLAGRIGTLEMLRRWIARGAAFAHWGKLVPIPGSVMLLKREAAVAAGGFRRGVMELFLDLQAAKHGIVFLPAQVSFIKAPATFTEVREQTRYDQRQLAAGLRHRTLGGGAGLFCVRVLRPLVETAALVLAGAGLALGWVPPALAWLVLLVSVGAGLVLSIAAVALREMADPEAREPRYLIRLFLTAIPENLGYRQLRNLRLVAGFLRG